MVINIDNKKILFVNLRTEKVIEVLKSDFQSMIGIFFLNSTNEEIIFVMIFIDKIIFFKIIQNSTNNTENIIEFKSTKFGSHGIKNYLFNSKLSILALERKDKNFDFMNLSNEKYFTKLHPFTFPYKQVASSEHRMSITKLFGLFKGQNLKNSENEKGNEELSKQALYKKNQFFLETIYKKLYFICLNNDESEIQFFHVESLTTLKKVRIINYDSTQLCTLQFIDNLILLHNFERCDTVVIDIKSEKEDKILCKIILNLVKNFPITSYSLHQHNIDISYDLMNIDLNPDDEGNTEVKFVYNQIEKISMLSYNNREIYEKNLIFNGHNLYESKFKSHYILTFDPMIYYENTPAKVIL